MHALKVHWGVRISCCAEGLHNKGLHNKGLHNKGLILQVPSRQRTRGESRPTGQTDHAISPHINTQCTGISCLELNIFYPITKKHKKKVSMKLAAVRWPSTKAQLVKKGLEPSPLWLTQLGFRSFMVSVPLSSLFGECLLTRCCDIIMQPPPFVSNSSRYLSCSIQHLCSPDHRRGDTQEVTHRKCTFGFCRSETVHVGNGWAGLGRWAPRVVTK